MFDTTIGAAIHNDTLTFAVRDGQQAGPTRAAQAGRAGLCGAPLGPEVQAPTRRPRRLYSSSTAGAMEKLDAAAKREGIKSRDQIINGLSPSYARVGHTTVEFYDKRSELHYAFRQRVAQGNLFGHVQRGHYGLRRRGEERQGVFRLRARRGGDAGPVAGAGRRRGARDHRPPRRSHAPRKEWNPYESIGER